jgi:hypothetical protein
VKGSRGSLPTQAPLNGHVAVHSPGHHVNRGKQRSVIVLVRCCLIFCVTASVITLIYCVDGQILHAMTVRHQHHLCLTQSPIKILHSITISILTSMHIGCGAVHDILSSRPRERERAPAIRSNPVHYSSRALEAQAASCAPSASSLTLNH